MNLRQLEFLVAVCEEGSFTAAAQRCHVAQPSMSAAIGKLEHELGTPLFHRVGRSIRPTSSCDDLLPAARDALRAMQAADAVANRRGADIAGRLDLAVQPTLAATVGVAVVGRLLGRHPGVTVRMMSPSDDESVAELVVSGRCELGVGERSAAATLRWRRLMTDAFVLLVPPGVKTTDPPLRTVEVVNVVAAPAGTPSRVAFDEMCASIGVRPRIVVEAEPRDALLPLVAAGVGAAVVPASSLPASVPPGVGVVDLAGRRRSVGLLRRRAGLTPPAEALWRLVALS